MHHERGSAGRPLRSSGSAGAAADAPRASALTHAHCAHADYLPYVCVYCELSFCGEHRFAHACAGALGSTASAPPLAVPRSYFCLVDGCASTEPVEYRCALCSTQTCLRHRDPTAHACRAEGPEGKGGSSAPRPPPTRQAEHKPPPPSPSVSAKPKSDAVLAMEAKVRVMRVKGRAKADPRVPEQHRLFLEVLPPQDKAGIPAAYLCLHAREHTLGHALDQACAAHKVINPNSSTLDEGVRLHLYAVHPGASTPQHGPLPLGVPLHALMIEVGASVRGVGGDAGVGGVTNGGTLQVVRGRHAGDAPAAAAVEAER